MRQSSTAHWIGLCGWADFLVARLQFVPRVHRRMKLFPKNTYHIFNRGNDKQRIFFSNENYYFFLRKTKKLLYPLVDFLAYCLMPNHFHFMMHLPVGFDDVTFSNTLKTLLSSYTRAINVEQGRTGSLFQQNSKAKCLTDYKDTSGYYSLICLNYIHLNPVRAGLTDKAENWEFSSFKDYLGLRNNNICNLERAKQIIEIPADKNEFYKNSYSVLESNAIEKIF